MNKRSWIFLLILEVLPIPLVIFLFRSLNEQRQIAGLIAGSVFLLVGLYIFIRINKGPSYKCFTFWAVIIHLGFSTLPMLITRLLNWGVDFTQVMVWGMPGPVFHIYSERLYVLMIVATIIDYFCDFFWFRSTTEK